MPAHNTPKRPAATQPLPTYGPLKIRSLSDLTRNQLTDVAVVLANRLTLMHPDTAQGLLNNPKSPTDSTCIDYQAVASVLAFAAHTPNPHEA